MREIVSPEVFALGQSLRNERLALHLSQNALAELSGLSKSTIAHIEQGTENASMFSISSYFLILQSLKH